MGKWPLFMSLDIENMDGRIHIITLQAFQIADKQSEIYGAMFNPPSKAILLEAIF